MSGNELIPFDFRNAGTSDFVVRSLKTWLQKSEGTFSDSWEATAGSRANLRCGSVLSRTFEEGVRTVGSACVGYSILLGQDKFPTLACIPNTHAIQIANHVVGSGLEGDPPERKLTSIEVSLCRMLFETFGSALSIAFAGTEPLSVVTGDYDESPQLSRLIPVEELVLCTKITMVVDGVTANVTWLLPRKSMEHLFENATGTSLARDANHPREIVMQLPLDLIGILGKTVMDMADVAELRVGDIVTLNQKINEPLTVCIDDTPIFKCWPGRIGRQQGLQIENVL